MKPKERFINYGLLSTNNCEPNQSSFKEADIPIDLSIKKPVAIANEGHFGIYKDYVDRTSFLSPPHPSSHLNEWPARYCITNLMAKHYGYHPNNIFPYLFINSGCLTPPEVIEKKPDPVILDPYMLPYRMHPPDGLLFPFKIDPHQHHHSSHNSYHLYNDQYHHPRERHPSHVDNPPLSIESSSSTPSSSSSPYEYHIPDYNELKNGLHQKIKNGKSQNSINNNHHNHQHSHHNNHHHHHNTNDNNHRNHRNDNQIRNNGSHIVFDPKARLKKAFSFPTLAPSSSLFGTMKSSIGSLTNEMNWRNNLVRSKSECNLHLIDSYSTIKNNRTMSSTSPVPMPLTSTTTASKICAPKKLFASNYYQNILKENLKESEMNNDQHPDNINGNSNGIEKINGNNNNNNNQTNQNSTTGNSNGQINDTGTRFYRNYRKEVIECWDNERRDNELSSSLSSTTVSTNNGTVNNNIDNDNTDIDIDENILDLRKNNHSNHSIKSAILNGTHKNNIADSNNINLNNHNHHNNNNHHHQQHNLGGHVSAMLPQSDKIKFNNGDCVINKESIGFNNKHVTNHQTSQHHHYHHHQQQQPQQQQQNKHHQAHQPQSLAHPLDLYKHYCYYFMQEPAFASRAAVAVAETYAKLLSNSNSPEVEKNASTLASAALASTNTMINNNDKLPNTVIEKASFENNPLYESKRTSPDCSQDGLRTELRSADTTNGNIMFDRKRISRPLTGKHVRHGTGASPSTLVSLRNMIQQRQKLKEIGKFDCNLRYGKGKANKRIKRK